MKLRPVIKALLAVALAAAALVGTSSSASDPKPAPAKADAATAKPPAKENPPVHTVEISVTEKGYQPDPVTVKKGEPVKLVVTRKVEKTCATELVMTEYGIDQQLPLNKPVEIAFTPTKTGKLKYGCAMGKMISATLIVE